MAHTADQRRLIVRLLRYLAKGIVVLAILTLFLTGWTWYLNRPPHYTVIPPKVPAHNALDSFLKASDAMQDLRDLNHAHIDWKTNEVSVPKEKPIPTWRPGNPESLGEKVPIPKIEMQPARQPLSIAALLMLNRKPLQLIREGLQHQYVVPLNPRQSYESNHRILDKIHPCLRYCTTLLMINAMYQINHADANTAANAVLDLIHFETQVASDSPLNWTRGYDQLNMLAKRLPAADVRRITARLEHIRQIRPSYAETIAKFKTFTLYDINTGLSDTEQFPWYTNRWKLAIPDITPCPAEERSLLINEFYAWTVPNASVPFRAERYLNACIRVARQPLSAHIAYPTPTKNSADWGAFGWDECKKEHLQWVLWSFQQDAALCSVALHGYRTAHGHYPTTLQALVDDQWLKQLPVDPFTLQDTLGYRNTGTTFLLYSRGPDGVDDGGIPACNLDKRLSDSFGSTVDPKYIVRVGSHGDIVYGIHLYAEEPIARL